MSVVPTPFTDLGLGQVLHANDALGLIRNVPSWPGHGDILPESPSQELSAKPASELEKYSVLMLQSPVLLKKVQPDEIQLAPIMRLILAHELAHALQDQELDLRAKVAGGRPLEDRVAFSAAMEGFALVIQEQVAKRLDISKLNESLERMLPGGHHFLESKWVGEGRGGPAAGLSRIYRLGGKVMSLAFERSGADGLWAALISPPEALRAVSKGPTGIGSESRPGYSEALAGLDKPLRRTWTEVLNRGGEGEVGMQYFRSLDFAAQQEVLSMLEYVHTYACIARPSGGMPETFAVAAYRLSGSDRRNAFDRRLREAAGNVAKQLSVGGTMSVYLNEGKISEPVSVIYMKWTIRVGDQEAGHHLMAWTFSGRHCLQLLTSINAEPSTLVEILHQAVNRLEKLP